MSFLVDTNILSEPTRPNYDDKVRQWLSDHQSQLYASTITIGEIRYGIENLEPGKRQTELQQWLTTTCKIMDGRILSFNASVAHVWGQLRAKWRREGLVMAAIDGQIAATAVRHNLIVATRNVHDFDRAEIRTVNPFE